MDSGAQDMGQLCFPGNEARRLLQTVEEAPLKDEQIANLKERVSNLEQQNVIQEKLTELAKRETEIYQKAFEKEKELTDRALKLAEISKPRSNFQLMGLLGAAAFAIGVLVGK